MYIVGGENEEASPSVGRQLFSGNETKKKSKLLQQLQPSNNEGWKEENKKKSWQPVWGGMIEGNEGRMGKGENGKLDFTKKVLILISQ